ncbi:MAG: hypothetical protein J6S14_15195 [Clostridia bacterium]|nr:hypothetical protein [Clostridia bacterium]
MFELSPCPVCGKQPKIRRRTSYIGASHIKIHCTPLLEKPHLEAILYTGDSYLDSSDFWEAAQKWNEKVKAYVKSEA